MEKIISFIVPPIEEDGYCYVGVDDGRVFQVTIPEHIAAGQTLVATIADEEMYLEYYHSEGSVGSEYGRAVPKLNIGSAVIEIGDDDQPVGIATTVGAQPLEPAPTVTETIRNRVLSSAMAVRVLAATRQAVERAAALDAQYGVSEGVTAAAERAAEKAEEIDREYHLSERAAAAGEAVLQGAVAAMDKVDQVIFAANAAADREEGKAEEEKK